jgi:hypothetical protein
MAAFSNEAWDTLPWLRFPKTIGDKLTDIMIVVPGLAMDMIASDDPMSFQPLIQRQIIALEAWRWAWEEENLQVVRIVPSPDLAEGLVDFKTEFSTRLGFDSLALAMDMLNYNATHLYLQRLNHLLLHDDDGCRVDCQQYDIPKSQYAYPDPLQLDENTLSIRRGTPLLLPVLKGTFCEHIVEALRVLPYIQENLNRETSIGRLIPRATIEVICWSLVSQPELKRRLDPMLDRNPLFHSHWTPPWWWATLSPSTETKQRIGNEEGEWP